MGDLRPLGSEKLQGMDKIKRIMEIARYNETPKQEINELSTTNYTITLADGNTYGIVKERLGYIIKSGLNESALDYNDSIRHRKYYRSYSEAMKKLNLMAGEINRVSGNEYETPLIGEQSEPKKKFVLKSKVQKTSTPETGGEVTPTPPPAEPTVEPAAPMDTAVPPATDETTPPTDDMMMPAPGEEGMEPTPGEEGMDDDMMPTPGDEGMEDEMGDEESGPTGLKTIQKLTGRLSQKIRSFDKEKGLDSQDIKYVVNSILSAIDLTKLDDEDRDEILNKIEDYDEYGAEGEGDLDIEGEDEFDMESEEGMGSEEGMEPSMMDDEEAPVVESRVERVLSGYFDIKSSEKPQLVEKAKRDFLNQKINKVKVINEISNMSESIEQMIGATTLLKENPNAKFIGKTNKENLVFSLDGKQIKVTPRGRVL